MQLLKLQSQLYAPLLNLTMAQGKCESMALTLWLHGLGKMMNKLCISKHSLSQNGF